MSEKRVKSPKEDAEWVKEMLSAVSTEVPALIKSILASVFSEEAGRSMGKAAAAYYKELKESGMPEDVAVKMTEDYMKTFTSLGNMLQNVGRNVGQNVGKSQKVVLSGKTGDELGEEIEKRIRVKLERRRHEQEGDEEEEEEE
jgi:hypothetical protein